MRLPLCVCVVACARTHARACLCLLVCSSICCLSWVTFQLYIWEHAECCKRLSSQSLLLCPTPPHHSILLISAAQQHTCLLNVLETVLLYWSTVVPVSVYACNGCCFCVTLPRAKGELAACHHPLCSAVDLFIYFFFLWGTGPLGSLFVWAVCSRSLKSWQKSFTVNRMHVFCHASTLLFIYFSCPGEMLQRGESFLPDHGRVQMRAGVYRSHQGSMLRRAVGCECSAPCRLAWVAHREERQADSVKKQIEGFQSKHIKRYMLKRK